MWDKFGYMETVGEMNELEKGFDEVGDEKSITELMNENGLKNFRPTKVTGYSVMPDCYDFAIGKIDVEYEQLHEIHKKPGICNDWVEYIKACIYESEDVAVKVRKKDKTLAGCIGAMMKWSFDNQNQVDQEIIKAAGVKVPRVTLGIPDMGMAKKIIREYYGGA